jgi:hypothetical protein
LGVQLAHNIDYKFMACPMLCTNEIVSVAQRLG